MKVNILILFLCFTTIYAGDYKLLNKYKLARANRKLGHAGDVHRFEECSNSAACDAASKCIRLGLKDICLVSTECSSRSIDDSCFSGKTAAATCQDVLTTEDEVHRVCIEKNTQPNSNCEGGICGDNLYCAIDNTCKTRTTSCSKGNFFTSASTKVDYLDNECSPCTGNTFQPNDLSTATSCTNKAKSSCGKGEYLDNALTDKTVNSQCQPCTGNTFQDNATFTGQTCTDKAKSSCVAGQYLDNPLTDKTVNSQCQPCTGNTFQDSDTFTGQTCTDKAKSSCGKGEYLDNALTDKTVNSQCQPCTGNKFQDSGTFTGQTCTDKDKSSCVAGQYLDNALTDKTVDSQCQSCTGNTFQDSVSFTGQTCTTRISSCNKGYKFTDKDSYVENNKCTECTGNTFQPNDASTSTTCSPHTPVATCAAGNKYEPGDKKNNNRCVSCASTHYSAGGDATINLICNEKESKCDKGKYLELSGNNRENNVCKGCGENTFQATDEYTGQTCTDKTELSAITCPAGKYAKSTDATKDNECDDCTGATFSLGGKGILTCTVKTLLNALNCDPGKGVKASGNNNNTADNYCETCDATTQYSVGVTDACADKTDREEITCVAGKYAKLTDATKDNECVSCEGETFSPGGKGVLSCTNKTPVDDLVCPPGKGRKESANKREDNYCVSCDGRIEYSVGGTGVQCIAKTKFGTKVTSDSGVDTWTPSCAEGFGLMISNEVSVAQQQNTADNACVECNAATHYSTGFHLFKDQHSYLPTTSIITREKYEQYELVCKEKTKLEDKVCPRGQGVKETDNRRDTMCRFCDPALTYLDDELDITEENKNIRCLPLTLTCPVGQYVDKSSLQSLCDGSNGYTGGSSCVEGNECCSGLCKPCVGDGCSGGTCVSEEYRTADNACKPIEANKYVSPVDVDGKRIMSCNQDSDCDNVTFTEGNNYYTEYTTDTRQLKCVSIVNGGNKCETIFDAPATRSYDNCGTGFKFVSNTYKSDSDCQECTAGSYQEHTQSTAVNCTLQITECGAGNGLTVYGSDVEGEEAKIRENKNGANECTKCTDVTIVNGTVTAVGEFSSGTAECAAHPVTNCGGGEKLVVTNSTASKCEVCDEFTFRETCSICSLTTHPFNHAFLDCLPTSICQIGQGYAHDDKSADATCTACTGEFFQDEENHTLACKSSDIVCGKGTILVGNAGSNIAAPQCQPCPRGQYNDHVDHKNSTCKRHTTDKCGPGEGWSGSFEADDGSCEQCNGVTHYNDKTDNSSCTERGGNDCGTGTYLYTYTVATHPNECKPCNNYRDDSLRYYQDETKQDSCKPKTNISCSKGFYLDVALTNLVQDSKCVACPVNTYQDQDNFEEQTCTARSTPLCLAGEKFVPYNSIKDDACEACIDTKYQKTTGSLTHSTDVVYNFHNVYKVIDMQVHGGDILLTSRGYKDKYYLTEMSSSGTVQFTQQLDQLMVDIDSLYYGNGMYYVFDKVNKELDGIYDRFANFMIHAGYGNNGIMYELKSIDSAGEVLGDRLFILGANRNENNEVTNYYIQQLKISITTSGTSYTVDSESPISLEGILPKTHACTDLSVKCINKNGQNGPCLQARVLLVCNGIVREIEINFSTPSAALLADLNFAVNDPFIKAKYMENNIIITTSTKATVVASLGDFNTKKISEKDISNQFVGGFDKMIHITSNPEYQGHTFWVAGAGPTRCVDPKIDGAPTLSAICSAHTDAVFTNQLCRTEIVYTENSQEKTRHHQRLWYVMVDTFSDVEIDKYAFDRGYNMIIHNDQHNTAISVHEVKCLLMNFDHMGQYDHRYQYIGAKCLDTQNNGLEIVNYYLPTILYMTEKQTCEYNDEYFNYRNGIYTTRLSGTFKDELDSVEDIRYDDQTLVFTGLQYGQFDYNPYQTIFETDELQHQTTSCTPKTTCAGKQYLCDSMCQSNTGDSSCGPDCAPDNNFLTWSAGVGGNAQLNCQRKTKQSCDKGKHLDVAHTSTIKDSTCKPCEGNTFQGNDASTVLSCANKTNSTCPKGQGLDNPLSDKEVNSVCGECPVNTFSNETDDSACENKEDLLCPKGQGLDNPLAEKTDDSKCVICTKIGSDYYFSDQTDDSACEVKTKQSCPEYKGLSHELTDNNEDSTCVLCNVETHWSPAEEGQICRSKSLLPCQEGEKYVIGLGNENSKCAGCDYGSTYMDESNHKMTCKTSTSSCGQGSGLYKSKDATSNNICLPCDRSSESICEILAAKGVINSVQQADCSPYLQNKLNLAADFNTLNKFNDKTDDSGCLAHGDIQCQRGFGRVDGDHDSNTTCRECHQTTQLQEWSAGGVNEKCKVKTSSCTEDFTLQTLSLTYEDNKCICANNAYHPDGNTAICLKLTVCGSDQIQVSAPQLIDATKTWTITNGYKTDRVCAKKCSVSAPQNGAMGNCASEIASGTSCQPTCNEGYDVSGVSTCLDSGLDAAVCTEKKCDITFLPSLLTNGNAGTCANKNTLNHGESCVPTCDNGYVAIGSASCDKSVLKIDDNVMTSNSSNLCVPQACGLPDLTNGNKCPGKTILNHGESCQPTCNNGYQLSGGDNNKYKCELGSLNAPTCIESPCDTSTSPANGGIGNCPVTLNSGSSCQQNCKKGFKSNGKTTSCVRGVVQTPVHACLPCGEGHQQLDGAFVGTTCTECPTGTYDHDQDASTACQPKTQNCTKGQGLYKGNSKTANDWVCKQCNDGPNDTLNKFNDGVNDQPCAPHKNYDDSSLSPDEHAEACNARAGYHIKAGNSEKDATCEPCGKGKISLPTQSTCTTCSAGTEQTVIGFSGIICPDCPVDKYDHDQNASTACQSKTQNCVKGQGLYKGNSKTADDWVCKPCDNQNHDTLNQFNDKVDDQPCAPHKNYDDSSLSPDEHAQACNAVAGYHIVAGNHEDDAKCEPCAAGTFSLKNESTCSPCPTDTISAQASGSCTLCGAGETATNNVCVCATGFKDIGGVCTAVSTGCTNPQATNYNANANEDDGNCTRHCVGSWSECVGSKQTYTVTVTKIGKGNDCPSANNDQEDCVVGISTDEADTASLSFSNLRTVITTDNKDAKKNGKSLFRQVVEKNFDIESVKIFANLGASSSDVLPFLKNNVRTDTTDAKRTEKIDALKILMPKKVKYTNSFDVSGSQQEKINKIKKEVADRYNTVEELVEVSLSGTRRRLLATYRRKLQTVEADITVQTDVACQDTCTIECDGFTDNSECKPYTVCQASQYETVAPTATTDRVCSGTCETNVTSSNEAEHLNNTHVVRLCDLCVDNYYTQAGSDVCHACPAGLITVSKIDRTLKLDTLDQCVCPSNHRVYRASDGNLKCSPCPPGYESDPMPVTGSSARETSCVENPDHCEVNEHVKYHKCVACPPGVMNARGDNPNGEDTQCDDVHLCQENFHVQKSDAGDYECKKCPESTFNHGGDNPKNKFATQCCALGNYESVDENVRYEGSCEADSECSSNNCDTDSKSCRVQIEKVCRACGQKSVDVRKTYNELSCCHNTDRTVCNKLKIDKEKHCGNECPSDRAPASYTSDYTPTFPPTTTAAPTSAPTTAAATTPASTPVCVPTIAWLGDSKTGVTTCAGRTTKTTCEADGPGNDDNRGETYCTWSVDAVGTCVKANSPGEYCNSNLGSATEMDNLCKTLDQTTCEEYALGTTRNTWDDNGGYGTDAGSSVFAKLQCCQFTSGSTGASCGVGSDCTSGNCNWDNSKGGGRCD